MGKQLHGGTRTWALSCADCTRSTPEFAYTCANCGGVLLVDPAPVTDSSTISSGAGLWRHRALLPTTTHAVTLGEANTPLVSLRAGLSLGAEVHLKLESVNPTLSFKDRAMALGVSFALDRGFRGLVLASTGNAAVSASAYAAAAGLECRVLVGTESGAARKLDACRAYGAHVEEVEGDYSAAYQRAIASEQDGWLNVSTTYRNPILAEAYRAVAIELVEDLGTAPSAVVVPVGAGPFLRGIERGFADAIAGGITDRMPRMIAVQAAAVSPIAARWLASRGAAPKSHLPSHTTIATAIADRLTGYESHGQVTIDAVERTSGSVFAVDESAIVRATGELAHAGLWVEPSSAVSLAALPSVIESAPEGESGAIVLMLTGHGAKSASVSA